MRHLDLFSGIGGFALAARWAGIETVAFCEIDQFCQKVLKKHWPDVFIFDDVRTLHHFQHVDILTAGFPCQPFSLAGKQRGKDDDRYLWPEVIRVIREVKPTWCILENVPGIIPMLDSILEDLEKEGYSWRAYLIPASAIGAPHKRERIWIVAHANSKQCSEMATNRNAITKRSEWTNITATVGNVIGDTDSLTGKQANKRTIPQQKSGHSWERYSGQYWPNESKSYWQENQPPIPGVDDGVPSGMDRNKSLGNAIVPQIAYWLMKLIKEVECEPKGIRSNNCELCTTTR